MLRITYNTMGRDVWIFKFLRIVTGALKFLYFFSPDDDFALILIAHFIKKKNCATRIALLEPYFNN